MISTSTASVIPILVLDVSDTDEKTSRQDVPGRLLQSMPRNPIMFPGVPYLLYGAAIPGKRL